MGDSTPASADWILSQKKVFTNWVNLYLSKRGLEVKDLQHDLSDGVLLCNLMEIISGKKLPTKWKTDAKIKLFKVQNLNIALNFIADEGIRLVSCGAEDIEDGNQKIIMGLIWTLILRYQIQTGNLADKDAKKMSPKDLLMNWVQQNTLNHFPVKDFHVSWQDGRAFCALVHRLAPEHIDLSSLSKDDKLANLNLAFDTANKVLGVPKLLDANDIAGSPKPDEQSIMTYVSLFPALYKEKGITVDGSGSNETKKPEVDDSEQKKKEEEERQRLEEEKRRKEKEEEDKRKEEEERKKKIVKAKSHGDVNKVHELEEKLRKSGEHIKQLTEANEKSDVANKELQDSLNKMRSENGSVSDRIKELERKLGEAEKDSEKWKEEHRKAKTDLENAEKESEKWKDENGKSQSALEKADAANKEHAKKIEDLEKQLNETREAGQKEKHDAEEDRKKRDSEHEARLKQLEKENAELKEKIEKSEKARQDELELGDEEKKKRAAEAEAERKKLQDENKDLLAKLAKEEEERKKSEADKEKADSEYKALLAKLAALEGDLKKGEEDRAKLDNDNKALLAKLEAEEAEKKRRDEDKAKLDNEHKELLAKHEADEADKKKREEVTKALLAKLEADRKKLEADNKALQDKLGLDEEERKKLASEEEEAKKKRDGDRQKLEDDNKALLAKLAAEEEARKKQEAEWKKLEEELRKSGDDKAKQIAALEESLKKKKEDNEDIVDARIKELEAKLKEEESKVQSLRQDVDKSNKERDEWERRAKELQQLLDDAQKRAQEALVGREKAESDLKSEALKHMADKTQHASEVGKLLADVKDLQDKLAAIVNQHEKSGSQLVVQVAELETKLRDKTKEYEAERVAKDKLEGETQALARLREEEHTEHLELKSDLERRLAEYKRQIDSFIKILEDSRNNTGAIVYQLESVIEEDKQKHKILEEKLATALSDKEKVDKQLVGELMKSGSGDLEFAATQLKEAEERWRRETSERERAMEDATKLRNEVESLKKELESRSGSGSGESSKDAAELDSRNKDLEALRKELDERNKELEKLRKELEALSGANKDADALRKELEEHKKAASESTKEAVALKAELDGRNKDLEALKKEVEERNKELEQLRKELEALRSQSGASSKETDALKQELERLKKELEQLNQEVERLTKEAVDAKRASDADSKKIKDLQARIAELEELLKGSSSSAQDMDKKNVKIKELEDKLSAKEKETEAHVEAQRLKVDAMTKDLHVALEQVQSFHDMVSTQGDAVTTTKLELQHIEQELLYSNQYNSELTHEVKQLARTVASLKSKFIHIFSNFPGAEYPQFSSGLLSANSNVTVNFAVSKSTLSLSSGTCQFYDANAKPIARHQDHTRFVTKNELHIDFAAIPSDVELVVVVLTLEGGVLVGGESVGCEVLVDFKKEHLDKINLNIALDKRAAIGKLENSANVPKKLIAIMFSKCEDTENSWGTVKHFNITEGVWRVGTVGIFDCEKPATNFAQLHKLVPIKQNGWIAYSDIQDIYALISHIDGKLIGKSHEIARLNEEVASFDSVKKELEQKLLNAQNAQCTHGDSKVTSETLIKYKFYTTSQFSFFGLFLLEMIMQQASAALSKSIATPAASDPAFSPRTARNNDAQLRASAQAELAQIAETEATFKGLMASSTTLASEIAHSDEREALAAQIARVASNLDTLVSQLERDKAISQAMKSSVQLQQFLNSEAEAIVVEAGSEDGNGTGNGSGSANSSPSANARKKKPSPMQSPQSIATMLDEFKVMEFVEDEDAIPKDSPQNSAVLVIYAIHLAAQQALFSGKLSKSINGLAKSLPATPDSEGLAAQIKREADRRAADMQGYVREWISSLGKLAALVTAKSASVQLASAFMQLQKEFESLRAQHQDIKDKLDFLGNEQKSEEEEPETPSTDRAIPVISLDFGDEPPKKSPPAIKKIPPKSPITRKNPISRTPPPTKVTSTPASPAQAKTIPMKSPSAKLTAYVKEKKGKDAKEVKDGKDGKDGSASGSSTPTKPAPLSPKPPRGGSGGNSQEVDKQLAEILAKLQVTGNITKVGDCQYQIGSKKVTMQIISGYLVVRVGGGFMKFEEWILRFGRKEGLMINGEPIAGTGAMTLTAHGGVSMKAMPNK